MREHLRADLPAELRAELDAFLFDWFDARCQPGTPRDVTPEHEAALTEAVALCDTDDTEAALGWFRQRAKVFRDAARRLPEAGLDDAARQALLAELLGGTPLDS